MYQVTVQPAWGFLEINHTLAMPDESAEPGNTGQASRGMASGLVFSCMPSNTAAAARVFKNWERGARYSRLVIFDDRDLDLDLLYTRRFARAWREGRKDPMEVW